MKKEKFFITGGFGYIGTSFAKEAIKLGKTNNADYNKHKHEFIQSILAKQKKQK
jgi:hypothetical protein